MATDAKRPTLQKVAGIIFSRWAVAAYWVLNLSALCATVAWVCLDGEFTRVAVWSFEGLSWWKVPLFVESAPAVYETRVRALAAVSTVAAASFTMLLLSLFIGRRMQRSLKAWLVLFAVVAAWLTLHSTWPELAWRAQAWRVSGAVPAAEKMVTELLADWPEMDGSLPQFGPFMAYPIGHPRTLMFIHKPELDRSGIQFSQVELSGSETAPDIHLQLAGNESGAWLTHTADGEEPMMFLSGLETTFFPRRFAPLGGGWWLVDYSQGSIVDSPNLQSLPVR